MIRHVERQSISTQPRRRVFQLAPRAPDTRDRQGHLISCEHLTWRVTLTVIADSFRGKRLNSRNDVVVSSNGKTLVPNVCLGGRLNHQLFITAITSTYAIDLNRRGCVSARLD